MDVNGGFLLVNGCFHDSKFRNCFVGHLALNVLERTAILKSWHRHALSFSKLWTV